MASIKDKIHAILLRSKSCISDEEISTRLGISRSAVDDAVRELKADGCEIECVTNKGYRLIENCQKLCAGTVMAELSEERQGSVTVLESVDSTNTYLRKLLLESAASAGDCVIADRQTGGRGRLGRSFYSSDGKGVYLSYCLTLGGVPSQELSQITAWASVAVRDAIYKCCSIETGIKWVNDLVCGGKKLCGILTEMSVVGQSGEAFGVVVGIGINANQELSDFPQELSDIATSVKIITGKETDRARLCAEIISRLDRLCEDFPHKKDYYLSEYRKSCAVVEKKVRIIKNDTERTGTAIGIDENFGLVVDFDDGERETLTGGEVSVRGFYGYM